MRAGLSLAVFASRSRLILSLMMGEKKPDREDVPPPCRLPVGGKKPPCWPLPDLIRKPLIEYALSPMNQEIFGQQTILSLRAARRPPTKKGARRRPFCSRGVGPQVSRLEKRTVVARAR